MGQSPHCFRQHKIRLCHANASEVTITIKKKLKSSNYFSRKINTIWNEYCFMLPLPSGVHFLGDASTHACHCFSNIYKTQSCLITWKARKSQGLSFFLKHLEKLGKRIFTAIANQAGSALRLESILNLAFILSQVR